ncbi:MAG: PD-(D/E)XK nuclease family protein [Lachnospiraceae bacterium]|nr:PD-(D/E)XK nuclease family protein [Lachnospiraceae bacterium]
MEEQVPKTMQERILLAPGVNGVELLKNLAMHGRNTFHLRIMNANELASYVLMRSGISITEDFVDAREEIQRIAAAIGSLPEGYFGKVTYADICHIASAISTIRCLVTEDGEEEAVKEKLLPGLFGEKNQALYQVYECYREGLKKDGLVDRIDVIRKAIREGDSLSQVTFYTLKEFPLKAIEKALLEKASGSLGELDALGYETLTLPSLYGTDGEETSSTSKLPWDIFNCYGAPNEVEHILTSIYTNHSLDECVVAVSDEALYGQIFFDYALLYDIPITFGCGIPIGNSNPAKLLTQYSYWMTNGFYGKDALEQMLESPYFSLSDFQKNIFTQAGLDYGEDSYPLWKACLANVFPLRFTNDSETNRERIRGYEEVLEKHPASIPWVEGVSKEQMLSMLRAFGKELALPTEEFIRTYSRIRYGQGSYGKQLLMDLDLAAGSAIYDQLCIMKQAQTKQGMEDMIRHVLQNNIEMPSSIEGHLHVTTMDKAAISLRKCLFVAGLSASYFPGNPKEQYLLLDVDLEAWKEEGEIYSSQGRIKKKQESFLALLTQARALSNSIHLSYSGLDVSELKRNNISSSLYEIFNDFYTKAYGRNATLEEFEQVIQRVEYFEPGFKFSKEIGLAYVRGDHILGDSKAGERIVYDAPKQAEGLLAREYSPSAIHMFFDSPRDFMFRYVLGIPVPEERDVMDVYDAKEKGTLAHSLMETLAETTMEKQEFLQYCSERLDDFIKTHPPVLGTQVGAVRAQFIDMMSNAYDLEPVPKRPILLKEEELHVVHEETGIRLMGYPDRVETLEDGSAWIVDFKTGRTIRHVKDDIQSCMQVVIYAYMLEQQNLTVSGGEFRYFVPGEVISCKYDEEMKDALTEKLTIFRSHLQAWDFPESLVEGVTPEFDPYHTRTGK